MAFKGVLGQSSTIEKIGHSKSIVIVGFDVGGGL
jgi:hypothetical protein